MYSLPITTYSDYWRMTKVWSTYIGGAIALWASTSLAGLRPDPLTATVPISIPLNHTQTVSADEGPPLLNLPYRPQEKDGKGLIPPGQQIRTEFRIQEVPVPTDVRESNQVPPGMKRVIQEGSRGLMRQVVKQVAVNGVVEEQVVHEFELNAPKKRVVIQNTKEIAGSEPLDLSKVQVAKSFTVEATAYTYTGNRTATGIYPRKGLIAVDPKVVPLGSRVYVEGYGYAIAADTGGAILGNKVDVFFPTLRECLDWGRRPVRLYLLASSQ